MSASETGDQSGSSNTDSDSQGTDSDSQGTATDSNGTTGDTKFDVGTSLDVPLECGCGSQLDFSYIWPSNSNIGQVSKINTETMVEEGRFWTSPQGNGSPSRSSVSLSGLNVAINNRVGGIVKITTRNEDCDEMNNGQPGLQTSSGKDDVLAWGEDDCIDWYIDPYGYTTQRPIGYIPGPINEETCEYENQKLWSSGCNSGSDQWVFADRIDNETGDVDDHVPMTGFACGGFGGYGGAVDADGNFWVINLGSTLVRVDHDNLDIEIIDMPAVGYGVTVDTKGRPWIATSMGNAGASAARYDPDDQTWAIADNIVVSAQTGIQEDAEGRMWMNTWTYGGQNIKGVTYIDRDTMMVGPVFELPTYGKGMSIDLAGNVWALGTFTDNAARYNPETDQFDVYDGVTYPYTYSDMSGWGLHNTTCNPAG
jgi:hypothetical protein